MRVVIINTDYGPFLRGLYESEPELASCSYDEQMRRRNETLFGGADFYSRHFTALGHPAWEVHANNGPMQLAWLRARGRPPLLKSDAAAKPPASAGRAALAWRLLPPALRGAVQKAVPVPNRPSHLRSPIEPVDADVENILVEQVKELRPDIVLNQSVSEVESRILHRMQPHTRLIVGQIASPLPEDETYVAYDLMISSLPNFVRYYRQRGLPAELNRLAFEPSVLDRVGGAQRDVPVSFVGSITSHHSRRFNLLERLATETEIQIWGRLTSIPESSPIWRAYRGEAWGADMYRVLARSRITVNQHIDIADNHANNMRLFEATGMGALLITDRKDDIAELFEPGKEIVCYESAEECIELIRHYQEHETEGAEIAAAGQRRTLRDYHYRNRVMECVNIFERYLHRKTVRLPFAYRVPAIQRGRASARTFFNASNE